MPMDRWGSLRPRVSESLSRSSRELAEKGPRAFRIVEKRGHDHQAVQPQVVHVFHGPGQVFKSGFVHPGFLFFPGQAHLEQHGLEGVPSGRRLVQQSGKLEGVHAVDEFEAPAHVLGLVGLHSADEMPADIGDVPELLHFLQGFLGVGLAKQVVPALRQGGHAGRGMPLGHGHHGHVAGVASHSARRFRDFAQDPVQPHFEIVSHFLNDPSLVSDIPPET